MITDIAITTVTPGTSIVTLAKAKKHLRLEASFTEEDDLIQDYIDAAVTNAENYIGGYIVEKDMVIKMTGFDNPLVFEAFPVQSVTSVSYFTDEDVEAVLPDSFYKLRAETAKRFALKYKGELPNVLERDDAVTVTIRLGMTTVEKPISQAVLLMVADMYERREDRGEVYSTTAMALLRAYKKF